MKDVCTLNQNITDKFKHLNEKGYVILPTDELSKEDKKKRKLPNISFIVKLTHLEK